MKLRGLKNYERWIIFGKKESFAAERGNIYY